MHIAISKYGMSAKFTHLLLYIMIMLIILYPVGIILLSHNPILLTEVNNIVWIIVCIINTFNNTAGPRGPARTARRLELLIVGSGRGSSFSSFPYFHGIGVRTAGHLQRR